MMTMNPFGGRRPQTQTQNQQFSSGGQDMTIDQFMAGIRRLESGSFDGDYAAQGRMVRGDHAIGAYQIMSRYWDDWATSAGVPGANWRDPSAQDHVARHVMQKYYDKLQNWDLVALAWYAGGSTARKVLERGYSDPADIQTAGIRQYVEEAMGYARESIGAGFIPKRGYGAAIKTDYPQMGSNWLFPVAGPSEWSRGSYMPDTKNHRHRTHAAIDIYAESGTPIVSPVRGKVLSTKFNKLGGNNVRIQGDDGFIYYMAHMRDAAVVGAGQMVGPGQHLGFVGNTGSAARTKAHVHFSVRTQAGKEVSPISFLSAAKNVESFAGYEESDFGNNDGIGPIDGAKMASKGQKPQGSELSGMLDSLSNKMAGGTRDPSIYQNYMDPDMGETP